MRRLRVLLILLLVVPLLTVFVENMTPIHGQSGGVIVIKGPTPIMEGEAKGPEDVTIMNEYLAAAFGISTTPPWGIPPGHIIDLAPVAAGASDVLAQFSLPLNDWANWATITSFKIVENSTSRAIIEAIGQWKGLVVNYTYILESGKPYLRVIVTVTNNDTITYSNHIMGPAISLKRGWAYAPGFGSGRIVTAPKSNYGITEDWVASYHQDYALGLYAPNYTHIALHSSFVDAFYQVTLAPGDSRVFDAYIIVFPEGDLCKIAETVQSIKGEGLASVHGNVLTTTGNQLPSGVVMVESQGRPYCWSLVRNGSYSFSLPAPRSYSIYALAKAHAPSTKANLTLNPGDDVEYNFTDVIPPGRIILRVFRNDTGEPTDARILISGGYVPPVMYLATTTVYTDVFNVGTALIDLAPGTYNLTVDKGSGFISTNKTVSVSVASEQTLEINVTVDILFKPWERGWYMVDLHHHSDWMDGRTPPDQLVVAQLASALDILFVSDHDYVGNCPVIQAIAQARSVPFVCGVEISPDWAHFNVYPILDPSKLLYRGTMREIITSARAAGAIVVRANHPYIGGLFIAQEMNNIPGGYYEDWDAAEINGPWGSNNQRTLTKMFTLWDFNIRKYLTAGSDVHDVVMQTYTGKPRVVAYLPNGPDPISLALAEKYGRTFITYGPFVFTNPLPGSTVGAVSLSSNISITVELYSALGLSRLEVYGKGGRLIQNIPLGGVASTVLDLSIPASTITNGTESGYIVVIAYDLSGNRAINNPIWIDVNTYPVTTTERITETETITQTQISTVTTTQTATVTTTSIRTETTTFTSETTLTTTQVYTTTHTTEKTETLTTTITQTDMLSIGVVAVVFLATGVLASKFVLRK
ncbi:MAG: CehA/McbA family metallohydrolase [Thermosphaera sp.]